MKYCPTCDVEVDPKRLKDPETCPECGGQLDDLEPDCQHQWRIECHGWARCVRCGAIEEG